MSDESTQPTKSTRDSNPILFQDFLAAYVEAVKNKSTKEELAKVLRIKKNDMKYLRSHISKLQSICRDEGLKFEPLSSSRLSEDAKKALVRNSGIFDKKK